MKWPTLILGLFAFQFPLMGEEVSFAALWTSDATYSEGELLALAQEPDPTARQFAALRLAELDPCTDAALGALLQALGDPVDSVRFQALAGLARLGRRATPGLATALSDLEKISGQETSRSDLAFAALIHAAERDEVDVAALLRAYQSTQPETSGSGNEPPVASSRERMRRVLEEMPVTAPSNINDLLRAGAPSLQLLAAKRMILTDEDASAVLILTQIVREADDESLRQTAADTLARIVSGGPKALQNLLKHQNPQVRSSALLAYPENAADSPQLVATLLNDPALEVRRAALSKIGNPEQLEEHYNSCFFGEGSSALVEGLQESVLSKVLALSREPDTPTREAAVLALGALGCARPESAPAVSEALAAMLSDPVEQVASSVTAQLSGLLGSEAAPTSPAALGRVLDRLPHSPKEERANLLTVLQYMALPEARRKELIDTLLTVCLLGTEDWACELEQEILSARPGWPEAATAALVSRYPDVRTLNGRAWEALESLNLKAHLDTQLLKQLLDHPEKKLRVGSAIALAKRDQASPRVIQVLEEGVRSYTELEKFGEGEASQALASMGEQGIERLIAIMKDPGTEMPARLALIAQTLLRVAGESTRATEALLAAASDSTNPEIQKGAVDALCYLRPRPEKVRATLEKAFLNGAAEVRRAVAFGWKHEAPEDFLARVFTDPVPGVREAGFPLLALLPEEDPKRLPLMAYLLKDTDEGVRDRALSLVGKLGERGAALLTEYVQRGEPLTDGFFSGINLLDSLEGPLGFALAARLAGESPEVRNRLIALLASDGIPLDREFLYIQLEAASEVDRYYSARALEALGEDPWARGRLLAAVLMDSEVRRIMEWRLRKVKELLDPSIRAPQASIPASTPWAPKFPWPPPPGYSRTLVPRELFATSTLGDVQKKLVGALEKASEGFDHGLFSGPADGFTLVARMERIERDGTPLPEPARWIKDGSPKLKLSELLADLFFEKPGYFRTIVFAVTDDLVPEESASAHLPEPKRGAAGMPHNFAERPFDGKEVLALIYSFERRHDAKITPWTDGAPSARQHLERAGVWPRLEPAAPRP